MYTFRSPYCFVAHSPSGSSALSFASRGGTSCTTGNRLRCSIRCDWTEQRSCTTAATRALRSAGRGAFLESSQFHWPEVAPHIRGGWPVIFKVAAFYGEPIHEVKSHTPPPCEPRRPSTRLTYPAREPVMVNARCIALAFLSYSACGRAFVLRPRVASAHVINKPHGFVGLKQHPTRSRRVLGTTSAVVVASAAGPGGDESTPGVHSTEDALSPLGEVGAARPWDVRPAGVAAAVAGVALAGGLLHPELANAATDSFGESGRVVFFCSFLCLVCVWSWYALALCVRTLSSMLLWAALGEFCVVLLYCTYGEERMTPPTAFAPGV